MSTYTELFSINIMHEYYTDGVCPDFSIEPTPECLEILEGHRIVVKNKINGVQLVLPVDEGESFIDIAATVKFTFHMNLNEMAFSNYTDLENPPISKNQIYYYDNQGSDELTPIWIEKSEVTLPVNDAVVFAVIDIDAGQLNALDNPSQYTISFTAGTIPWSYYFITNPSPLKITSVHNILFPFNLVAIDGDPIGEELQEKYPHNDIRLYRSDDEISYRQQGIKNIEFRVTESPAIETGVPLAATREVIPDALIEHLPNPGIYDNGVKILKVII